MVAPNNSLLIGQMQSGILYLRYVDDLFNISSYDQEDTASFTV
jgi:hypothetical protein